MAVITEYTNKEIEFQKYSSNDIEESKTEFRGSKPPYTQNINTVEMQALLSRLYYAGVMKMGGVFTKELFDKHNEISIFRAKYPKPVLAF